MKSQLFALVFSAFAVCASAQTVDESAAQPGAQSASKDKPIESVLRRAASRRFDVRLLPQTKPVPREREEIEEPENEPTLLPGKTPPQPAAPSVAAISAPAPPPIGVFEGLDRFNWGAGSPPDTNGDVGPTHYIQTVNTSIGIFRKSDGFREAAFTFDTFMSQGNFGNLCDTENFGDPVVLYDTFEDRWIITDFAFLTDASNNVVAPAFQCIAVSMNGDPLAGGWNFYSRQITDFLNDYPKFGIWPDGLYMSANMFSFGVSSFKNARVWAFNKAQMYAGAPTAQVVSFDIGGGDFTVIPSNARLQTGTPPAGLPNLFLSTQLFLNALTVYKFHVDWAHISLSTFTGPDTPISATSWPSAAAAVPQLGTAQTLDSLSNRAMVQNQYTNFGGTESLWVSHTVRRQNTTGFAAPRWYQVNVTGGTVAANIPQAATWDPDGANVLHRWMPSLALDRAGNMAMGYSTSSLTTFPSMAYAGRLASDPVNTFSQTEQVFFTGSASQLSSTRWGDYSAMTLDPDGCTFWYTSEYATGLDTPPVPPATVSPGFDKRWQTKFGSIAAFPGCVPVGAGGTVSGTVTNSPGGTPISGATVMLGSRSTSTDGSGAYSFAVPAGTYLTMSATFPGCTPAAASNIVVTDGNTTTQNFALAAASGAACLTDTTQADFLSGVPTNVDPNVNPGDVTLLNVPTVDQSNTAGTTTGTGFATTSWGGQSFIPAVTGTLAKVDVQLFCSGCTGTTPNLTLSVRATSGGLPTGADLATANLPGFSSGAGVYYTVAFGTPATLTSGTQYALILRPTANPSVGGYFWIRSSPSTYANGQRVISTDNGATWTADSTRDFNFRAYMQTGYTASGDFISSTKDANPAPNFDASWNTLSWTATTPANTAIKFQAAASNSAFGPFNFVGPDGTAGTYFTTSGASLSQFYSKRYLQYRAYLSTTDNTMTPTLSDVTVCYSDPCTPPPTPTVTPGGPTSFCAGGSVTLTSSSASGNQWYLTGNPIGGATSQTYLASLSGNYTDVVTNGLGCASAASSATTVTVNPQPSPPTINADTNGTGTQDQSCPEQPLTLHANGGAGTSYQWYQDNNTLNGETSSTTIVTGVGTYYVTLTDANSCTSAQSAGYVVQNPTPHAPFITFRGQASGVTSFAICQGGSQIIDSDSATGIQWYKDGSAIPGAGSQSYTANQSGIYTAQLNALGCHSQFGRDVTLTVNPTPATPTITPGGPTTFFAGQSVTLTSSSASGNQWSLNGNPIGGATNTTYVATAAGSYTVTVTGSGCSSAQSAATVVTVNPAQADLALTLNDHVARVMSGESVNYIIEVTNAAGPSPVNATVTDALPAGLINGSWVCISFGGATCANGVGNTLSDSVTLPVGAEAAYVYSATVMSGNASDQLTNSASVAVTNGTDPTAGNNSASDTDSVHIFIDGFEGTPLMRPISVGAGAAYVTATVRIDPNLLGTLSIVPTAVGMGRGADGKALFTIELARFASDIVLRLVTPDAHGASQRSSWQVLDMQQSLLSFDWQSASSAVSADGYIRVGGAGTPLTLGARDDQGRLTQLWVRMQDSVPWLVLVTH
jgi:uncharacterized repeat protein (TIGR01451 family)